MLINWPPVFGCWKSFPLIELLAKKPLFQCTIVINNSVLISLSLWECVESCAFAVKRSLLADKGLNIEVISNERIFSCVDHIPQEVMALSHSYYIYATGAELSSPVFPMCRELIVYQLMLYDSTLSIISHLSLRTWLCSIYLFHPTVKFQPFNNTKVQHPSHLNKAYLPTTFSSCLRMFSTRHFTTCLQACSDALTIESSSLFSSCKANARLLFVKRQ